MRIMLLNHPHPAIGSRIPHEHLPPLGLLAIGGSLLDAGHTVKLIDGEFGPMPLTEMADQAAAWRPDAVLIGHSGSTSGHPIACELFRELRRRLPNTHLIYGGVFPTYHYEEILATQPQIDVIVRGEGEQTIRTLITALETHQALEAVEGIAFRHDDSVIATPPAQLIEDLDAYRIGWELVNLKRYSYWGDKPAVVVQFSRGCPHQCSYCGQRGFWTRWRHRDPVKFAEEIAWLHRTHGIEVFNLADENPTALRRPWKDFLEALIATGVKVTLVGSTRADDIVRDADLLPLYKKAGVARWLLGIENYDAATLQKIQKGGSPLKDRQAIDLLRQHGILSLATWVVGFAEERDRDYLRGLRQLLHYDPDQIQMIYATPHRWTPYFHADKTRRVIQTDLTKWDYKHQVLSTRHVPAWRVLLWVKFIESIMQLRPRALARVLWRLPQDLRPAHRWYYRIGRRVWFHAPPPFSFALLRAMFSRNSSPEGPTLAEFWNHDVGPEEAMISRKAVSLPVLAAEEPKDARAYGTADALPARCV